MKEKIKKLREQRGLSQIALAQLAGVHWRTVGNVENGRGVSVKTLEKLAVALEMPPAYFLS